LEKKIKKLKKIKIKTENKNLSKCNNLRVKNLFKFGKKLYGHYTIKSLTFKSSMRNRCYCQLFATWFALLHTSWGYPALPGSFC